MKHFGRGCKPRPAKVLIHKGKDIYLLLTKNLSLIRTVPIFPMLSSYLNRYRLGDYQTIFEKYSQSVEIMVLEKDIEAFNKTQPRIKAEFLTDDMEIDSVMVILAIIKEM